MRRAEARTVSICEMEMTPTSPGLVKIDAHYTPIERDEPAPPMIHIAYSREHSAHRP
jgi:hypothetical protein